MADYQQSSADPESEKPTGDGDEGRMNDLPGDHGGDAQAEDQHDDSNAPAGEDGAETEREPRAKGRGHQGNRERGGRGGYRTRLENKGKQAGEEQREKEKIEGGETPQGREFRQNLRAQRDQRPENDRRESQADGQQTQQEKRPHGRGQRFGGEQRQQRQAQGQGIDISIVIPLYNEDGSVRELYQEIRAALGRTGMRWEVIFIDDGSTDRSFQILKDIRRTDQRVKVIRFRRNYGKSAALNIGFAEAAGSTVFTMDADLQDDPAEIPNMLRKLNDGFDLISGWKRKRKDPISKTIPSKFFNWVTSRLTGIRIHDFNCGFKAYRREVVKSVRVYGELHRYVPVLAHWNGFRVGEIPVNHRARRFGKSKFGLGRFWKGFLDLLTVLFTTRYMQSPLHLFGFWGLLAMVAGLAIDGWLAVEWFMGQPLGNRPLFLVGVLFIIVGIQLISLGLLGEMITKSRQAAEDYSVKEILK